MTDTKAHDVDRFVSLEGRVFRPVSAAELAEVIEWAFDYRGDVALELISGETVIGYLFNRQAKGDNPSIEFFPEDDPSPRAIAYSAIASIAFAATAVFNTYILCRYPAYRKIREKIAEEEDKLTALYALIEQVRARKKAVEAEFSQRIKDVTFKRRLNAKP